MAEVRIGGADREASAINIILFDTVLTANHESSQLFAKADIATDVTSLGQINERLVGF